MKSNTTEKRAKPAGSGRQAMDGQGTIVVSIRLTPTDAITFRMLGGVDWLRSQIATERNK